MQWIEWRSVWDSRMNMRQWQWTNALDVPQCQDKRRKQNDELLSLSRKYPEWSSAGKKSWHPLALVWEAVLTLKPVSSNRQHTTLIGMVAQHGLELTWLWPPCLLLSAPVFKRISILDRIEYRILFAFAKLTESNNEYYSCCEIYSNNIRIVQDIRIFE